MRESNSRGNDAGKSAPGVFGRRLRVATLLLATLAAGAFFVRWMIVLADRELRAMLLQHTRLVAQAVDVRRVQALSGTDADLTSADYLQLKEQLATIRASEPQCRFVYLMGRKPDGVVFFYVDSEPADSEGYSPPGQVYEEATSGLRAVLDSRAAAVEGPAGDRWGRWVSGLVRLTDPATGALVAILGMDMDAGTWTADVASQAAVPVGLTLVLLIVATAIIASRRAPASPTPVMRRVLPPTAAVVALLVVGAATLWWRLQQQALDQSISTGIADLVGDTRAALNERAADLEMAEQLALSDSGRTGRSVAGLALAAALPVYDRGIFVGQVVSGEQIESILKPLQLRTGAQTAVVVRKELLDRQTWEEGVRRTGRQADWDRLPQSAVIYASQGRLPDVVAVWADSLVADRGRGQAREEVAIDGKDWSVSAVPLRDASGGALGELIVMRDITTMKAAVTRRLTLGGSAGAVLLALLLGFTYVLLRRTDGSIRAQQAEVLDREERLRLLIENSHDVIFTVAADGTFTFASSAWTALLGHPVSQVVGRSFQLFVHPDDVPGCMDTVRSVVETGLRQEGGEYRIRHADGSWRWHTSSAVPLRDQSGKVVGLEGTARDVTEQRAAEEKLRDERRRLRSIIQGTNAGTWEWNVQTGETAYNEVWAELVGYTLEELAPTSYRTWEALAHPDDLKRSTVLLQRHLAGELPYYDSELRMKHKDGQWVWIHDRGQVFTRSSDGAPLMMYGTHTDITNAKRAEAELRKANLELEEATAWANEMAVEAEVASKAKSEFLANMSHEIRTPMNGVIGMTGLLLGTALDEEQRRYAEIVRSSAESLLGLIDDILDFSKIEAGRIELEALDFDLRSLLDDFAAALAVRAQQKGLELLCDADPAVPGLLRGDPGRLRQILTNLAGNAVKFTSVGEVAVRASLVEETEGGVLLRFSVRDTGVGIPGDKLGLLFDRFSQLDASTTRRYGGTGLGLAISKQLAGLMGGEVGVESEEGKGSEFWFTARLGRQARRASAGPASFVELRGVRALIVDDSARSREILAGQLASWGMRPSEARDGTEALRVLRGGRAGIDPFRMVVIDMQMPEMDGATLGRTIKEDAWLADTRMVALTSIGTRGDARRFEEIGFAAYATKPIRHQELKGVLSLVLAEREESASVHRPIVTRHRVRETQYLSASRNARILLAEDNITNQQVALGILRKLGQSADVVASGAEALEALETVPYDLVLMDVQMPEMDGLEATRLIRLLESKSLGRRVPIIAMTAHSIRGDREACLKAGMDDYVAKPVTPEGLAEALQRWLPTQGISGRSTPADAAGSAQPVYDREAMMGRLAGDEELAKTIVRAFLDDMPRQIRTLREHVAAGSVLGAERQAHTIKGASSNVGGERLRAAALAIETAGGAGDLEAVRARVAELERQFDALREAMRRES